MKKKAGRPKLPHALRRPRLVATVAPATMQRIATEAARLRLCAGRALDSLLS